MAWALIALTILFGLITLALMLATAPALRVPQYFTTAISIAIAATFMISLTAGLTIALRDVPLDQQRRVAVAAIATAAILTVAGPIALWLWIIRPQIKAHIEAEIEIACRDCRGAGRYPFSVELAFSNRDLQFECGAPLRQVRIFETLSPPSPRHIDTEPSARQQPLQPDGQVHTVDDAVASLRSFSRRDHSRFLRALLLIGSTDERRVTPTGRRRSGHRDNFDLANARAEWVEREIHRRLEPASPPIFVLHFKNLQLARLVVRNAGAHPIERPTGREVLVCALWSQNARN